MRSLPIEIFTAAQLREVDRRAADCGIAGYALMCRAGEAALAVLRSCWPAAQRIIVACGPGNNGGDGYVLARLARELRLQVRVLSIGDPAKLRGEAQQAYQEFAANGGATEEWNGSNSLAADVIVDALFGIGLARNIDGTVARLVEAINRSRAQVFALDIPSGLHADTGEVLGTAVHAQRTITFIGLKLGFFVGSGQDYTGVVMFDGLDVPAEAFGSASASLVRIDEQALPRLLPPRKRTAHKGQQGSVLVVGGGIGMAGAARMTGEAALRCGAGLVTVATHPANVATVIAGRPELMCSAVSETADLERLVERADLIALGPGLGRDEWAQRMFAAALANDLPKVVDADALNLLSASPRHNTNWILTPHSGEAGRLLGISNADVQRDRLRAVRILAERYGGVVVLKGAGTLVATAQGTPTVCDRGNPGMASPGMGDVLTGVISGMAAQIPDLAAAAEIGVLVHAMAGDMAARHGERGLLATDLFNYLPACVNPAQCI
jgi:NAD(P)H-hydrate epimerase